MKNYYDLLEISSFATLEEIKKAYFNKIKLAVDLIHCGQIKHISDEVMLLNQAFQELRLYENRYQYDIVVGVNPDFTLDDYLDLHSDINDYYDSDTFIVFLKLLLMVLSKSENSITDDYFRDQFIAFKKAFCCVIIAEISKNKMQKQGDKRSIR